MIKKLLSCLLVLTISCGFFASQASAQLDGQTPVVEGQQQFKDEKENTQTNLSQTSYHVLVSQGYGLLEMLAGPPCEDGECEGTSGAMGEFSKLIASTYSNPPANTQTYIADVMKDLNLAQPVYAQGVGFSSLQPVLVIWKAFRDLAYVCFVIIFLVLGFAIMFRQNLGSQAAITVQQALPRVVIAPLAVSFSYAIAGLLIDFMYLSMFFIAGIFNQTNILSESSSISLDATKDNFVLNNNIFQLYVDLISANVAGQAAEIVGSAVDNSLSNLAGKVLGGITSLLTALIIFFALVFAVFRTFFSLVKVYFEIILQIVFAPMVLMMGAINQNAFGNWVKGLAVNLMVFPALMLFVIVGYGLVSFQDNDSIGFELAGGGFVPPFIPGSGVSSSIAVMAGIGCIMFLPEVAAFVQKNKPASIFDELAPKAWENAMKGRGLGQPLGLGLIGAGAGALGGAGFGAVRSIFQPGSAKEKLRNIGNSAITGGIGGALAPSVVAPAIRTLRGSIGDIANQAGQSVSLQAYNSAKIRIAQMNLKRSQNQHQNKAKEGSLLDLDGANDAPITNDPTNILDKYK